MPSTPPPERVRELLTDKRQTPADHDRNGDAFFAEGRPSIALMFYERSRTPDRVEKILRHGVAGGDTFLVEWAHKMNPDLVTPALWKETGEQAMKSGRFAFARDAFQRAGDEARAGEASKALNQALEQS